MNCRLLPVRHICRLASKMAGKYSALRSKNVLNYIKSAKGQHLLTATSALHDDIKPLAWLLGRWRGDAGIGEYPTIKDFTYGEELYFYHTGHHYIHFVTRSWDAETKKPLHLESGFIRRKTDTNQVAITIATNIGFTDLEEGEVNGEELNVETRSVAGMTFFKLTPTTKIKRLIRRHGDDLEQTLWMATEKTPLVQHLKIRYTRISEDESQLKGHM